MVRWCIRLVFDSRLRGDKVPLRLRVQLESPTESQKRQLTVDPHTQASTHVLAILKRVPGIAGGGS